MCRLLVWLIVLALTVASCGAGSDEVSESASATPEPAASPSPTADPAGRVAPPDFEVVLFPGEECMVDGPTEVGTGQHLFVFRDESDNDAWLGVGRLRDDHTYAELADRIEAAPTAHAPDWIAFADAKPGPAFRYQLDADLADNEVVSVFDLKPGSHGIWAWQTRLGRAVVCGPLVVAGDAST